MKRIETKGMPITVIGIDHGYGNIKTANTITPTGVEVYAEEPMFTGNVLYFSEKGIGRYYRIGETHKPYSPDKTADNEYYVCTLMAIAKELELLKITNAEVHLAVGLPLTWVKKQRETFREYLTRYKEVEFDFNGTHYSINIVGCNVYPQGYTAVLDRLHEMGGTNILADIGNGTMNIMYIQDKKPVESKCFTEKMGVNQCVIAAKNAIMDEYGVPVDDAIIEEIFRTGEADIADKYKKRIVQEITKYCKKIFETLATHEYNSDMMRLYIVGGGSNIVRRFGEYDKKRTVIVPDVCATAKGYEALAYKTLTKEMQSN